jgi:hypothetical protein
MTSTGVTKSGKTGAPQQYGPYFLRLEFRRRNASTTATSLHIDPSSMMSCEIVHDINRFVPTMRLRLRDASDLLTHVIPFDSRLSTVHVSYGQAGSPTLETTTTEIFDIYRRFPASDNIYEMYGMLSVPGLFSPTHVRGFGKSTITDVINQLAWEMELNGTEVSGGLNYAKRLVQPTWSNAQFLGWLKDNVEGKGGEYGFYTFMKCVDNKTKLVFTSLREMVSAAPKYTFGPYPTKVEDQLSGKVTYPIIQSTIVDSYRALGVLGMRRRVHRHFDYEAGEVVGSVFDVQGNDAMSQDYVSLTSHFGIDSDDEPDDNVCYVDTGRSNGFTSDFAGKSIGIYHKGLTNLSKIWILTWGLQDVYPGDIVNVVAVGREGIQGAGFSYSGLWLVQRVVHSLTQNFLTRLLLTRSGINTSYRDTTLIRTKGSGRRKY